MAHLDQAGITELLSSAGVVDHLTEAAGTVAEEIKAIAPRHTGAYVGSIRVGEPTVDGLRGVVVPVESTSSFWGLVEFGSINNPPYAPMRRALANLGIEAEDVAKP